MSNLYEILSVLCSNKGITGYRLCKDVGIQPSIMTDLKSGRKKGLSAEIADKIASYFGVSVGYLLGTEQEKPAIETDDGLEDAIVMSRNGKVIRRRYSKERLDAIYAMLDNIPYDDEYEL